MTLNLLFVLDWPQQMLGTNEKFTMSIFITFQQTYNLWKICNRREKLIQKFTFLTGTASSPQIREHRLARLSSIVLSISTLSVLFQFHETFPLLTSMFRAFIDDFVRT